MRRLKEEEIVEDPSEFYCKSKKRRVATEECLERYVDANAFEQKRSACWKCGQGRKVRSDFADGKG